MKFNELLTELHKQGIILAVTDNGQNLLVTGSLTESLRSAIKEHKSELIKIVCHHEQELVWAEPDQLYLACQCSHYPKRVLWPDVGRVTYHNGTELYADIWQRSMVREALVLGGVIHV